MDVRTKDPLRRLSPPDAPGQAHRGNSPTCRSQGGSVIADPLNGRIPPYPPRLKVEASSPPPFALMPAGKECAWVRQPLVAPFMAVARINNVWNRRALRPMCDFEDRA